MIVALRYSDYDTNSVCYFIAPEGSTLNDFKRICDELIRECAREEVSRHKSGESAIITYACMVMDIAEKLPDRGYQPCELPTVAYKHGYVDAFNKDDENNVLGKELTAEVIAVNESWRNR